jgi:hypothetical protein
VVTFSAPPGYATALYRKQEGNQEKNGANKSRSPKEKHGEYEEAAKGENMANM